MLSVVEVEGQRTEAAADIGCPSYNLRARLEDDAAAGEGIAESKHNVC